MKRVAPELWSWLKPVTEGRLVQHADFGLLLVLFVAFRLGSVFFFRPGGYVRDYSDLIYYQSRASWQDYGFLPYRDYWSEYPPLFAWLSVWVDRIARQIPLWDDERLWYAAIFELLMVAAESLTFAGLYWLARHLHGNGALRVAWLYAGLFLPMYLLGGWFDALPVATIIVGLAVLLGGGAVAGPLLFGLLAGVGGGLKLTPLALLAVVPLALRSWRQRLLAGASALIVVAGSYAIAYLTGPAMTLASLRSLVDRSGWSTLYAWAEGYRRVGAVVGDVFDSGADMSLYAGRLPQGLFLAIFAAIGLTLWVANWRQQPPPQSAKRVVGFAALTYALLLLCYPAWNPQYALYLLPFIVLVWPGARGVFYALGLSGLCLLEHPVYVNLIGFGRPQPLLMIVVARAALLLAIALDLALDLLRPARQARRAALSLAGVVMAGMLVALPEFGRAYVAGRFETTPVRPLALYLNSLGDDLPVVMQSQALGRQLRPFLEQSERLVVAGGRAGRVEPLPGLIAAGPLCYVRAPGDGLEVLEYLERKGDCETRFSLADWQVWLCNGIAALPVARFDQGIVLQAALLPNGPPRAGPLPLTLFWRAEGPVAVDYTVFVHVVGPDEAMIGQWDQVPGAGAAPTST
jgi:hypothetical protein